MGILDAAMLDVDAATVERRIEEDAVLVAAENGRGGATERSEGVSPNGRAGSEATRERVLGACTLDVQGDGGGRDDTAHIDAIAVRRRRRDQGVGSALVQAAAERWPRLTAEFDADHRPFYESLGFDVRVVGGGRFRGVLE
jgi:GNAT superfamily N-acetyltransferase